MQRIFETFWGGTQLGTIKSNNAIINQAKLEFDHTTATHVVAYLPEKCILRQVVVEATEIFDGVLKLGHSGHDEAYLGDADFPKSVALHNPILIGAPISENTAVQLKVSGGTTGEGTIWIFWEPMK
jgi:hypothetical protein